MAENLNTFKEFVKIYIIFTIIIQLTSIAGVPVYSPSVNVPDSATSRGVIVFLSGLVNIVSGLLLYTISGQPIVNAIIWGYRIMASLELITYVRDLFKV